MPRILVIADDLTGAAEIAGIATRFGLDTQLLRKPAPPPTACDCVVYDTDTRLLPRDDAVRQTRAFADAARAGTFDWVFKKTDSVLRGEPLAEVGAVADVFRRDRVLFLPHNPSRGRCVANGIYRVHGVPLHQTEFGRDPLHSATSAEVTTLLRTTSSDAVTSLSPGSRPTDGVVVCEAASADHVAQWADAFDPLHDLAAGGADFFEELCRRLTTPRPSAAPSAVLPRPLLIVSGTASPATAALRTQFASSGRLVRMPDEMFDGPTDRYPPIRWMKDVVPLIREHGTLMMAIDRPTDAAPGRAEYLSRMLSESAARVVSFCHVRTVACEGGATAAACCGMLGWDRFKVHGELAAGVVALRPYPGVAELRFVVKPGSYAWPAL